MSNCCCHLANSTKNNVVIDSGPVTPLIENMTSSTKPELHNIFRCHQRRTEPQPQIIWIENIVKFGHGAFEICDWTGRQIDGWMDRHTDMLIAMLCPPTESKVIKMANETEFHCARSRLASQIQHHCCSAELTFTDSFRPLLSIILSYKPAVSVYNILFHQYYEW